MHRHPKGGLPRGLHQRRGVSLLEFVIIMPILLALTLGAVDFGRFAITSIAVTNAARAGAAIGSVNSYTPDTFPAWEQKVRDAIVAEFSGMGNFDAAQLDFPTPLIAADAGQPRRMRLVVSYPFETIAPWPLIPQTISISQAVEMPFIR